MHSPGFKLPDLQKLQEIAAAPAIGLPELAERQQVLASALIDTIGAVQTISSDLARWLRERRI